MKRKIISVLLTLVLVLSFSLVTAVPASAATITVPGDYATIQLAIDAASDGDIITVAAGTYTEDLTIGTALTLESVAGAATTIIATAGSVNDIVLVTAADVTIDGFTIDGANVASGAVNGIDVRNTGFTIQNNVFVEIYHDNIFTGATAANITSGLIDSNTFTGMGTSAAAYRPAINIESNASYAISGVTVSGNEISAFGGVESAGIQVAEVTGAVSAIVVSGNTIGTSSFGIATWNDAAATFTTNTITGCDVGVDIYGDVADLTPAFTLSGNTITGNTTYGIRVRSDANDLTGVGIVISGNTISGNGDGVAVVTSGTVNSAPVAENNWWGNTNGPEHSGNTFNVGFQGDTVSDDVDYVPWYDTDLTGTTFAPVNNTTQVTTHSSIQAAITAASDGDTITVAAGTYTEDLTIGTANLTLESVSGAATTIIATAGSPNDIVLVTAAGVTIDGFTIQGDGVASGAVNGIDVRNTGFTIQNNVFVDIYHDNIFTGAGTTTIALGLIDSNTFTGMGTSAAPYRPAINIESNASLTISGVTVSGNTLSAYGGVESAGIQVAEVTGAVSAIVVSGNTIGTSTFGIATWNDGAATFSTNTITGCDVGVDIYGSVGDLTPLFTFSGNTITGNTSYGIRVRSDANDLTAVGTVIKYNTISGNGDGIAVVTTGTVNSAPVARYNWWGSATGPAITATNPGATGDSVSANVTYAPWLYLPAATANDTVAEIISTETPAYANSVVLDTVGWDTFSVPIGLDGQYNTWAKLVALTSLDYSLAYRFDSSTQAFVALATTTTYAIAPGEGFYIKMDTAGSIPYCYSTLPTVPGRSLSAGWSLIGGGMTAKSEILNCVSIVTSGGSAGYTQIIGPPQNAAGSKIWYTGLTTQMDFVVGEGYWVLLPIARTLGLFDVTPVAWVP